MRPRAWALLLTALVLVAIAAIAFGSVSLSPAAVLDALRGRGAPDVEMIVRVRGFFDALGITRFVVTQLPYCHRHNPRCHKCGDNEVADTSKVNAGNHIEHWQLLDISFS